MNGHSQINVTARPDSADAAVRAFRVSVVVGVVVSFVGVSGALLAAGQGIGASLGLGAFVAFWGGLGFGVMIGGVVWATRSEQAHRDALSSRQLEHCVDGAGGSGSGSSTATT